MKVVIATRGSALALWQANHTADRLRAVSSGITVELRIIKTLGDKILDVPLAKVGGKGLFVKEIQQALLDGDAHIAVHSMKDVPAESPPELVMAAVSKGELPWDALIVRAGVAATTLDELPHGAVVGTSSMRRQCQLLARRPDLKIAMLRGNVPTRLARLDAGEYHAIVLAAAGLTRLGSADRITQLLPPEVCLPAVGQGVLGLEALANAPDIIELVRTAMHNPREALRIAAERAFQLRMAGSCETPLAVHAVVDDQLNLVVDGLCGLPDGTRILRARKAGPSTHAAELGVAVAEQLLAQGADEILAATRT